MNKKSFEIISQYVEDVKLVKIPEETKQRAEITFRKERKKHRIEGAGIALLYLFALIGILSLFSCSKCVECTTTTTITDLQDVPTYSEHKSFPICERSERKYWDQRKTTESKGTYKVKTYTTCK